MAGSPSSIPNMARRFVGETGVDALGVSIGNTHIQTRGKAAIDLALLERIRRAVDVPLVILPGEPEEFPGKASPPEF